MYNQFIYLNKYVQQLSFLAPPMKLVKIINKNEKYYFIYDRLHLCSKVLICCFTVEFQKDLRDLNIYFKF